MLVGKANRIDLARSILFTLPTRTNYENNLQQYHARRQGKQNKPRGLFCLPCLREQTTKIISNMLVGKANRINLEVNSVCLAYENKLRK